jgi:diguanylate cyclase
MPLPMTGQRAIDEAWKDERIALNTALLGATAKLTAGSNAEAILRVACDVLVSASPHVRLAWMYLGDPAVDSVVPVYAVGPACAFAEYLRSPSSLPYCAASVRQALQELHPIITAVDSSDASPELIELACAHQLEACAVFPFGNENGSTRGAVAVYVDQDDYFQRVGLDVFVTFAHLGQVALEQAALRQRLEELATFDRMTGLLNRATLQEAMEAEFARTRRNRRPFSLLLFDLDRFKLINDNFGHAAGDQVLIEVAAVTRANLRDGDWLARWGGEEFLAMLPDTPAEEALKVADRLRVAIDGCEVKSNGRILRVTVSVGVAASPGQGESLNELLNSADVALYEAKRAGRNRVVCGGDVSHGIFSIAGQLDEALACEQVVPAFQPIVELATGRVVADEALARIVLADGEVLEAFTFIEAACQLQLVHRIDFEIIRQTMRRCVRLLGEGSTLRHFVNVSADLLRHPDLVQTLLIDAQCACDTISGQVGEEKPLVIEITEREFIRDVGEVRAILEPLIDFGFRIAIDDFGSGYSSFQYLADLPVTYLKIEGTLVQRVNSEPKVRAILQGIQDIANELGLITLAEWVDSEATVAVLQEIGIAWAQGYHFGRPRIE